RLQGDWSSDVCSSDLETSIKPGIESSGWQRSGKPGCGVEPNDSTSNWTCCNTCASKRGGELLAESRKHAITAKLRQIPYLGPIRSALAVALIQTPHRFRSKRQLWAYSGLALETRISAEYRMVEGQVRRSKKMLSIDHNHDLKGLFKGAATMASARPGPFQEFYQAALAKGIKPTMARLTLARKIAAITLTLWKKGEDFDAEKLKSQAALYSTQRGRVSFLHGRGCA